MMVIIIVINKSNYNNDNNNNNYDDFYNNFCDKDTNSLVAVLSSSRSEVTRNVPCREVSRLWGFNWTVWNIWWTRDSAKVHDTIYWSGRYVNQTSLRERKWQLKFQVRFLLQTLEWKLKIFKAEESKGTELYEEIQVFIDLRILMFVFAFRAFQITYLSGIWIKVW